MVEKSFRKRRVGGDATSSSSNNNNNNNNPSHDAMVQHWNDRTTTEESANINLLLASLEKEAIVMEDEVEATLSEVLDRRHVTFANADIVSPSRKYPRPRTQQQQQQKLLPRAVEDTAISILYGEDSRKKNIGSSPIIVPSRPNLGSRSLSLGRCSGQHPSSTFSSRIAQSSPSTPSQENTTACSSNVGGKLGNVIPSITTTTRLPGISNKNNNHRHRRIQSAIPIGQYPRGDDYFFSGITTTNTSSLTTPGERAKVVALSIKSKVVDDDDDDDDEYDDRNRKTRSISDKDFPDLMDILESRRNTKEYIITNNNHEHPRRNSNSTIMGGTTMSHKSTNHDEEYGAARSSRYSSSGGGGPSSAENINNYNNATTTSERGRNIHASQKKWKHRPLAGISATPFLSTSYGFTSNVDQLFQAVKNVEELYQIPEDEDAALTTSSSIMANYSPKSKVLAEENDKFLSCLSTSSSSYQLGVGPSSVHIEDVNNNSSFTAIIEDSDVLSANNEQTPLVEPSKSGKRRMTTKRSSPRVEQQQKISHASITRPTTNHTSTTTTTTVQSFCVWWEELRKQMKTLAIVFDGAYVKRMLWNTLQNDVLMFIMPLLSVSAFFYYQLNNPVLHFLATDASISWWILFFIRHYVTLLMAYALEYMIVDVSAMRCLLSVQLIGPLATLYIINAKGWPFILTSWAVLNFLLIYQGRKSHDEGGGMLSNHWLYFTDIEMFTTENPSGGVVESDTYMEILLAMVIVGVSTSLKRTVLALYLGKRVYMHYRPKMEKIMESMILLTEVADLGNAIADFEFHKLEHPTQQRNESREFSIDSSSILKDDIRASTMIDIVKRQGLEASFSGSKPESRESIQEGIKCDSQLTLSSIQWNRLRAGSNSSEETNTVNKMNDDRHDEKLGEDQSLLMDGNVSNDIDDDSIISHSQDEPPILSVQDPVLSVLRDDSSTTRIKTLLDEWEEPVNKADKMADPTIHEILQFRKALTFLNDSHPFSSSFGPAFSRDSCIKSATSLYKRLLQLSPGSSSLSFDIIGVLAYNIDGTFDDKKAKSLVKLFRPDKCDEVSLLNFVQSCDGVYKRIRYLRASVGNSTLIDSVLENIFNAVFGFALTLVVLSVLELNPWTLLISLSTVLVSFAFALGPSAAKVIEGMIMIAIRRPFDLGDRISIVDYNVAPNNNDDPGYHDTWIVEDCNLFTTTLRLCRTNELSTVSNGAISNTRIVNHARSVKAIVNIQMPTSMKASHEQIQVFKSALEQYIHDKPRVWTSLIDFRIAKVDSANELVVYAARMQHVKSWQNQQVILHARGELEYFINQILCRLGIDFVPSYVVVGNQCSMNTNVMVPDSLYSRQPTTDEQSSLNQVLVKKQQLV